MLTFFQRLTAPPIFEGDEEKTRAAELLNTVLIALTVLALVSLFALFMGGTARLQVHIAVAVFALLLMTMQLPMRRGYIWQVSYLVFFLFTAVLTFSVVNGGTVRAPGVALYTLTIIMSGLIISRRAAYWSATLNTIIFLVILWLEINGRLPEPITTVSAQQGIIFTINSAMVAILLGVALRRINESLERARLGEEKLSALNAELEQRVNVRTSELLIANQQAEKRARQLQVVADVARAAASVQELSKLLNLMTSLISQRFGYYHIGIFLLDEQNEYAILEASNTEGGLRMLARRHRLKVGEQGLVGFVTSRGDPRIALDVGQDAVFFDNPDLPETHSELALPLKISEKIIGALDLQSTDTNAFSQDDINILSILADQVSVAIQNTRSLERAQRALHEAEIASGQLIGHAWKGYAEKASAKGYRYDGIKPEQLTELGKSAEDQDVLSVPVQLRGQTIGRLKLKASESNRQWTEDERAIIEATADRVALAMEGARLLDEAQKRAARESFLAEVGTRLGASFQMDSILRDTVEELGQALRGSIVSFQLVNPSAPPSEVDSPDQSVRGKKSE